MATTVQIADRLHAIHGTIAGVTPSRYYPQSADTARLPLILATPGRRVYPETRSLPAEHSVRAWTIALLIGSWMGGIPTETVHGQAEALIDAVTAAYLTRPRLELDGNTPLNGIVSARVSEDTGIVVDPDSNLAQVNWTLVVTHRALLTLEHNT
jgi:hypothetical protein